MAGKIKHAKPLKAYAKQHGVSLRTVKRRSKAGLPLGDNDLGGAIPPPSERKPELYNLLSKDEAGRRKLIVQWLKEVRQLAILDREYLSTDKVREDGLRIGATLDAGFAAFINDMPGTLAGLTELQIRNKLDARLVTLKESIKKELDNVGAH